MRQFAKVRSPIAGTSLCAVAVLGLSAAYAFVDPEGLEHLIGPSGGDASCGSGLMVGIAGEGTLPGCDLDDKPTTVAEDSCDEPLECCLGGVSRGALLLASRNVEGAEPVAEEPQDAAPEFVDEAPTFTKDVAPLLQKHCQECHRSDQIGPFPLVSYQDARKHAYDLATVTEDRRMPPWFASPDFGTVGFRHDRSLSEAEIATFQAWIDAGMPEGDSDDLPPSPEFPEGWALGTPDVLIEMAEPFEVPADGPDIFRCFVIPNPLDEDAEVIGIEYQPGNPRVVHHILGYIDTTGEATKRDDREDGPGYECAGGPMIDVRGDLGGWAPGANADFLPDGIGRILPKGSHIVLQIHYHPSGKPETDVTRLGLHLAPKDKPIRQALHWWAAGNMHFEIPVGEKGYEVVADTLPLPCDLEIHAVAPHMHWFGTDMTMFAETPEGERIDLIRIDRWDFNWQLQYSLERPIFLPAGSVVKAIAHYDNTEDHPYQPIDGPKPVRYGDATTDEMCFGFFAATKAGQDLTRGDTDDLHLLFRRQLHEAEMREKERRDRRASDFAGGADSGED